MKDFCVWVSLERVEDCEFRDSGLSCAGSKIDHPSAILRIEGKMESGNLRLPQLDDWWFQKGKQLHVTVYLCRAIRAEERRKHRP